MIVSREKLMEILEKMEIGEMDISIDVITEVKNKNEDFFIDKHKGFMNTKKIVLNVDIVNINIRANTGRHAQFVGFERQ